MNCSYLPGIQKIEFIEPTELIISPQKFYIPGDMVSVNGNFSTIELIELASCKVESQRTENGLVYTTSIEGETAGSEFSQMEDLLQNFFHVYRITDIYKNLYLIGTNQKPFPEISFAPSIDKIPSGQRVISFTITLISTLPPLKITLL